MVLNHHTFCAHSYKQNYIQNTQRGYIRSAIERLLDTVRRNAVPLVDAFDIPDFVLNSALGRRDGKVYEALWESTKQEPLNASEVCARVCLWSAHICLVCPLCGWYHHRMR